MHMCSCGDPGCMANGCKLMGGMGGGMWMGQPYQPLQPQAVPGQYITKQHIKDVVIEVLEELINKEKK